jgi:hypothetical protein
MPIPQRFIRSLASLSLAAAALGGFSACMQTDSGEPAQAFTVTVKSKASPFTSSASGTYGSAAAKPGNSFTFEFYAAKGSRLSFASMFGQSNDWFFAPDTAGIALYDAAGAPVAGDVSDQVYVWDAGTEMDQPPLQGSFQAPRQAAPNSGPADPDAHVRRVPEFPVGAFGAGPAKPGDSLAFEFTAPAGSRISFASMFGQSNDWFFAPDTMGIELYDAAGAARSGDITASIRLWDLGTEKDEPIGIGPNQAPRQAAPNTGDADPDDKVRLVADSAYADVSKSLSARLAALNDGKFRITLSVLAGSPTPISPVVYQVHLGHHALFSPGAKDAGLGLERLAEEGNPKVAAMALAGFDFGRAANNVKVTLAPQGGGKFQARIDVLDGSVTPVGPGAFSVHAGSSPLFAAGAAAPAGLEPLSEDGKPTVLTASLAAATGVSTPLSPVVWAIADKKDLLFAQGMADYGKGLESLAEEGNPKPLMDYLASMGIQSGVAGTSAFAGGASVAFDIMPRKGEALFLATMFGQSNDLFFAPGGDGIALWNGADRRNGDVTGDISLWDAGTEANEAPGAGPNQAPRQSSPGMGGAGEGKVQAIGAVMDGFAYPKVGDLIGVALQAR